MIALRFVLTRTGSLQVGTARVALANFLFARRFDGRFTLRLDDTDTARWQPRDAEMNLQDLRWLGIDWDECLQQSERLALYQAAAARLEQAGRLYPCFESDEELRAKRDQRLRRKQPAIYDRAMLRLTPAQRAAAEAGGKRPYWRFLLSERTIEWRDMVLGVRHVRLRSLSDPVLIRADGMPHRILAGAVDDIDCGISHVIRTEDLAIDTAVQLDLLTALGGDPQNMTFAHLPLLADSGGRPAVSLRSLRHDGVEADAVVACLAGSADPQPIAALAKGFEPRHCGPRFDAAALLAFNRRLLRTLPFVLVADRLPPGATEAFWLAVRDDLDLLNEARGWWDVVAGSIVPPVIEGEQTLLRTALATLPREPWNDTVWTMWTRAIREAMGCEDDALCAPLRLALTGEETGPALGALLPLIGRARAEDRLRIAAM